MSDRALGGGIDQWRFNPLACRADLDEFDRLLTAKTQLSERDDILPFFRAHPHLSVFLRSYHPNVNAYDRLGVEVPLFGEFVADVVAGDRDRQAYCFIEFEDGRSNSIFVRRGRRTSDWAARFDHGFSQIVDWLWLVDSQEHTLLFDTLFNAREIDVVALLVVGRDSGVSDADRQRLKWRRKHVVVNSQHVMCCTFDELLRDLRQRLGDFPIGARSEEST